MDQYHWESVLTLYCVYLIDRHSTLLRDIFIGRYLCCCSTCSVSALSLNITH